MLVRDPGDQKILALFTTDRDGTVETVVARYAHRWTIETAIAAGKQLLGIGQARNRLQRAVERTVPFEFVVYSLVIVWYALHGHHPDDLHATPTAQPWYRHKDQPAFEDMLAKLRRTLVAAQITGRCRSSTRPRQIPRLRTGLRRSRCVTAKLKGVAPLPFTRVAPPPGRQLPHRTPDIRRTGSGLAAVESGLSAWATWVFPSPDAWWKPVTRSSRSTNVPT